VGVSITYLVVTRGTVLYNMAVVNCACYKWFWLADENVKVGSQPRL